MIVAFSIMSVPLTQFKDLLSCSSRRRKKMRIKFEDPFSFFVLMQIREITQSSGLEQVVL